MILACSMLSTLLLLYFWQFHEETIQTIDLDSNSLDMFEQLSWVDKKNFNLMSTYIFSMFLTISKNSGQFLIIFDNFCHFFSIFTPFYAISYHFMPFHAILCHFMPFYTILCQFLLTRNRTRVVRTRLVILGLIVVDVQLSVVPVNQVSAEGTAVFRV